MPTNLPTNLPTRLPNRFLFLSALFLILGAMLISPHGQVREIATLHRFWLGAGVMGTGFVLSWRLSKLTRLWFWSIALITRLLLLPMEPGDDIWRYLWEGHIQTLGFNPYQFAPNAPELELYRTEWWSKINHPDVSAIYPPITQIGFRLLAHISVNVYLFKFAFVLSDLFTCWLLSRRFGWIQSTLYAWNPMIIYSFAGGAHYDSWLILPLVVAWLVFDSPFNSPSPQRFNWFKSALLIGVSVAVKWISLPILVFLIWRSFIQTSTQSSIRFKLWKALRIGLCGILPVVLAALPFCQTSCSLIPTRSVFVSYGRSAEFIPYFVAQVWPASLQANWIYAVPLTGFTLWLILRVKNLQKFIEFYWFGLLTLTPIIHFWYFTWLIPFAVPSQNWGARLVSLSAFIYFVLPSRIPDWRLTEPERLWLWLPFVLGWFWTAWQTLQSATRAESGSND